MYGEGKGDTAIAFGTPIALGDRACNQALPCDRDATPGLFDWASDERKRSAVPAPGHRPHT